jgi:predicted AAA+ superfamily ATPase
MARRTRSSATPCSSCRAARQQRAADRARGTGKSSLIKACLNAYAAQGLRLIEVDKADLTDLPDIVDVVAGRPEKFIILLR